MNFKTLQEFSIVEELGTGAFGRALLVKCSSNLTDYVIKEINLTKIRHDYEEDAEKMVQLSMNEYEQQKHLNHPNIVRVFGWFSETRPLLRRPCDFFCLVMEYCDGGDLESAIRKARSEGVPFLETQIQKWVTNIVAAIKYLHDNDVIHRDIKPKNIFLTNNRIAKLGDFGTAKTLALGDAEARTAVATWVYASPEMIRSTTFNKKSDIWSLGVTTYELINLKRPFPDGPACSVHILTKDPIPFQFKCYSEKLKALTLKMLEKDLKKRLSVDEIIKDSYLQTPVVDDIQMRDSVISTLSYRDEDDDEVTKWPKDTKSSPLTATIGVVTGGLRRFNRTDSDNLLELTVEMAEKTLRGAADTADVEIIRNVLSTEAGRQVMASQLRNENAGDSLLHIAARAGQLEVIRTLVRDFAWPIDRRNVRGSLPIHSAAHTSRLNVIEFFLKQDPSLLEKKGFHGRSVLQQAILGEGPNCQKVVQYLIVQCGADLTAQSSNTERSLAVHTAASGGNLDALALLLEIRPDMVEAKDAKNNTPLNRAVCNCHSPIVEYLVTKKRANVENSDTQGRTPLLQAAAMGYVDIVSFLLRKGGANINAKDSATCEDQAIHLAAGFGHADVVSLLLDHRFQQISAKNMNNDTALNRAASCGHFSVVQLLLKKGAERRANFSSLLENSGERGWTPLLQAVVGGHLEVFKLLVQSGANHNAKDAKGDKAIHLAVYFGHIEIIKYLQEKYGNRVLNQTNGQGILPLAIAQQNGAKNKNADEIIQLLQSATS